jgi:soluble lytic murein transglycosylase-like protein
MQAKRRARPAALLVATALAAATASGVCTPALAAPTAAKAPAPAKPAPAGQAAREAFYAGEIGKAYELATQSGERWIAGLAAFRLKRYPEAQARFAELLADPVQNEWVRSGAAFWAARAATAAGRAELAPQYLMIAARTPYTFYGLIAERQLGLAPAVGPKGLDAKAVAARGAPVGKPRFDISQFPMPDLTPKGGFTLEKALVYALVRQESRFNPAAIGSGGAMGLMQLMPATAARVAGELKLGRDPVTLKDPAVNLRLGQVYVAKLLDALDGDILHAVAAYNSGPLAITRTLKRMGDDADSLLAIESMPGASTREFVQRVMANYWIYRNLFGQESSTLDAAAMGAKAILATLDRPKADRPEPPLLSGLFAAKK